MIKEKKFGIIFENPDKAKFAIIDIKENDKKLNSIKDVNDLENTEIVIEKITKEIHENVKNYDSIWIDEEVKLIKDFLIIVSSYQGEKDLFRITEKTKIYKKEI